MNHALLMMLRGAFFFGRGATYSARREACVIILGRWTDVRRNLIAADRAAWDGDDDADEDSCL